MSTNFCVAGSVYFFDLFLSGLLALKCLIQKKNCWISLVLAPWLRTWAPKIKITPFWVYYSPSELMYAKLFTSLTQSLQQSIFYNLHTNTTSSAVIPKFFQEYTPTVIISITYVGPFQHTYLRVFCTILHTIYNMTSSSSHIKVEQRAYIKIHALLGYTTNRICQDLVQDTVWKVHRLILLSDDGLSALSWSGV